MTNLQAITTYTNQLLQIELFQDYCPNGLQVQGRDEIRKIVSGVTASQALIDAAIEKQADVLLVHHGFFWKGEDPRVVGMRRQRLQALLANQLSLVAYHLPLDAHAELGNNAQLAQVLGFDIKGGFGAKGAGPTIGLFGDLHQSRSAEQLAQHIDNNLGRAPLLINGGSDKPIQRIAWCTGAAQSYIELAIPLEVDAFLTGEISEPTVHIAREMGIHFYSCGHHATERYGAKALGEHLAERFQLEHEFVDIDNPV